MDLLTNNHIKSLRKGVANIIPYQFIKYLVQNYINQLNVEVEPKKYNDRCLGKRPIFLKLKEILDNNDELNLVHANSKETCSKGFIKALLNNIKIYYWYKHKVDLPQKEIESLINMDCDNLQNLTDDLNLRVYPKDEKVPSITVEQKNLFFVALDYYYLILELELQHQYPVYKKWLNNFRDTFVFKNIFKQLDGVLYTERTKRLVKNNF
jgi:hypothetical protein